LQPKNKNKATGSRIDAQDNEKTKLPVPQRPFYYGNIITTRW